MLVLGGGVIGLELGSVYQRLGTKVTVIEYADKICNTLDSEVSLEFLKILKKQGINFLLSTKLIGAKNLKTSVEVEVESKDGKQILSAEKLLVSTGRIPYTKNL